MKLCQILFLLSCILSTSCHKPEEQAMHSTSSMSWGVASATVNGLLWAGTVSARKDQTNDDTFSMHAVNSDYPAQSWILNFRKVPLELGSSGVGLVTTQEIDGDVGARLSFLGIDVLLGYYDVSESDTTSYVKVSRIDEFSGKVDLEFDITLIAVHKPKPDFPDTLRFRKGRIRTRVME